MQNFSTAELDWIERYTKDEFTNDITEGNFTHLHLHSDNAVQQFKITSATEYFTSLINDCGGATDCMYVYSCAAPGQRKGFFDGLSGALKNIYTT